MIQATIVERYTPCSVRRENLHNESRHTLLGLVHTCDHYRESFNMKYSYNRLFKNKLQSWSIIDNKQY